MSTFSGYFGCVDITVRDLNALSSVFEGDHFISQYLNSPMQRGFSATCLQTVRDVYTPTSNTPLLIISLHVAGLCQ